MKNQWFFKVFEGVLEGPWEAKVRIALTLKRFGGYRGKSMKKQWFVNVFEGPREGQGRGTRRGVDIGTPQNA